MPRKNTVKIYLENGFYHIYNRGIEKRRIFEDSADYQRFLRYLKLYLTPSEILHKEEPLLRPHLVKANLAQEAELLAYCLMPNHFHLLVHQKTKDATTKLMHQVTTSYSMYFNKRYERLGSLFEGIFKAVYIDNDEYLLHLSRYIHQNPKDRGISLVDFPWSSYQNYLTSTKDNWVNPLPILDYFKKSNPGDDYRKFVEETEIESQDLAKIQFFLIE